MTPRRAAAALCAALFLHLSLWAGDLSCATHGGPAAAAVAAEAAPSRDPDPHAHHGQPESAPDDSAPGEDCTTPTRADCCAAMASCGIAVVVASVSTRDLVRVAHDPLASPTSTARSRTHPPDTPPPRA